MSLPWDTVVEAIGANEGQECDFSAAPPPAVCLGDCCRENRFSRFFPSEQTRSSNSGPKFWNRSRTQRSWTVRWSRVSCGLLTISSCAPGTVSSVRTRSVCAE